MTLRLLDDYRMSQFPPKKGYAWTIVVAVSGTILGAIVAGAIQHQTARAERVQDRAETLRREQFDALLRWPPVRCD